MIILIFDSEVTSVFLRKKKKNKTLCDEGKECLCFYLNKLRIGTVVAYRGFKLPRTHDPRRNLQL